MKITEFCPGSSVPIWHCTMFVFTWRPQVPPAVDTVAEGGGTDAAFASLNTKAPVLERFGLQGFGAHANDAEYIAVDSIEPRLYLLARLIMDVSQGKDRQ